MVKNDKKRKRGRGQTKMERKANRTKTNRGQCKIVELKQ